TGGLENLNTQDVAYENIHHHTGGLEIIRKIFDRKFKIHHHTGGLENTHHNEKNEL
ncbi:hypothetical protein BAZOLSSOX_1330, partial [uncultured Gammaproteobacteria bacterium]